MSSATPAEVIRLGSGDRSVVLISPLFMDSRVWGRFAEDLATHASVSITVWPGLHNRDAGPRAGTDPLAALDAAADDLPEVADVVVAVGQDAAAAVHLAASGRARGIVLINPNLPPVSADFIVFDHEIRSMPEERMEAMSEAVSGQDAAALGRVLIAAEPDLSAEDGTRLAAMVEDSLPLILAVPEWLHYSQEWQLRLPDLRVPLALLAPDPESSAGPLRARIAETYARVAGDAQVHTLSSVSDYPWLTVPDEVLTPIRALLARLAP